jgi:hypothetical protein
MTCTASNGVAVVAAEVATNPHDEDDKTVIRVVPISVTNDDSTVLLEGMFFDDWAGWTEEDEPEQALTIEKDVLDRSSGYIIGRFSFDIAARAKIVFRASLDGKVIDDYGTGLPYGIGEGEYDTTLFNYNDVPNTAKANKDGPHKVHVEYALITGITESQLGLLEWGELKSKGTADFVITLLPHKITD